MSPEKFYHKELGAIFEAICCLADSKSPVDTISVSEELYRRGNYDACGGSECIKSLIESVPFADHGEYYAKIAVGYYYEREIIRLAGDLVCSAADAGSREKSCTDYLDLLRLSVFAREQIGMPSEFNYTTSLFELLDELLKKKSTRRYEVGLPSLDSTFGGLLPGEVVTWGAAPNVGKSVMLLNIASHCLMRGDSVLYLGTEMSAQETAGRHLSMLTSIEPQKIRSGNYSPEELEKLQSALADRMHKLPMRIVDLPEPSLANIEASLSVNKADVVFLDYLQRFDLPKDDSYRLRINEFMRQLKNLARKYKIVVHLASQLSREAYNKDESRPILSHLSESSGIEKESDRVVLLWAPKEKNKVVSSSTQILEVILAKNRHGRRGLVFDVQLDEKSLRVSEVSEPLQQEAQYT